jgi:hypothetical protein
MRAGVGRWLALALGIAALDGLPLIAKEPGFAGEWNTDYGRMILRVDHEKVTGSYGAEGRKNAITGTLEDKKLTFTYLEPGISGEGEFTLSEDGQSFAGRWRPSDSLLWNKWSGQRAPASPIEKELQQLNEQHEAALQGLLQRALDTSDEEAAKKIKEQFAVLKDNDALKQAISGTRWKWYNSTTFDSDRYWIEFHADGVASCQWGWPLIWTVEAPDTLFLRRSDLDGYVMHFKMDMTKLQGVADPKANNSHDPRSIRFERRIQ